MPVAPCVSFDLGALGAATGTPVQSLWDKQPLRDNGAGEE